MLINLLTSQKYELEKHVTSCNVPTDLIHVNIHKICMLVGCLMAQQHASLFQGQICSDKFTCCHTEIEVADQTSYFTQSQYTDTGLTL